MAVNKKLKILCLHGYRQDAETFRSKMGGFRKSVKNIAELAFVTSPFMIPNNEASCNEPATNNSINKTEDSKGYSWWFCDDTKSFSSKTPCLKADGFTESLNSIREVFRTQGPFDGILGFSQGAAFAALICGLKEKDTLFDFQFVIIIAGFKSLSADHQHLYENIINLPSLHIIGENDTCISKGTCEKLVECFSNHAVIYHDGGHYVPSHSDVKKGYLSFLQNMYSCVNENM